MAHPPKNSSAPRGVFNPRTICRPPARARNPISFSKEECTYAFFRLSTLSRQWWRVMLGRAEEHFLKRCVSAQLRKRTLGIADAPKKQAAAAMENQQMRAQALN